MIEPSDLPGVADSVARRLIATARSIAPCIDSLPRSDRAFQDVLAILAGAAAEVPAAGTGRIKSQSRNGTSVTWADYGSAFSADDRAALRALCGTVAAGGPVGHFPPSTMTRRVWPAEELA